LACLWQKKKRVRKSVVDFIHKQTNKTVGSGAIVDREGRSVGAHQGIVGYTIGQRKGLGIALGQPVYVTKIDAQTNTVVVGEEKELYKREFSATDVHWLSVPGIKGSIRAKVRIRYKHKPDWARVFPLNSRQVKVAFEKPQRAITPGQLAVFYDRDVVMGSAWIETVLN
jgi:tRNA-specific 2-thiouridylase